MFKKVGWISAVVVTAIAVGGVATTAALQTDAFETYDHDPAPTLAAPTGHIASQSGGEIDTEELRARLAEHATDPRLGKLSGVVKDTKTGQVVWEQNATSGARPASTTKILTAAAALLTLDRNDRIETQVVQAEPGTVVIKGAGDVMLTNEQLDQLASQIGSADRVLVDTSLWSSDTFLNSWGRENIASGYIAPMEPVMLYGARIGATSGDVPRSTTPAADVAKALADRLGANAGLGKAPEGASVIASTQSEPLWQRLEEMMEESDNVMAEAVGREVALKRGTGNTVAASVQATREVLQEAGFDLTGLDLKDNSGLSENNVNTARLLDDVLFRATSDVRLRPLLDTLPIASANGTLANRYLDLAGRGWVRAKTGTLTGTSALAGLVTSAEGNTFTFALICNDVDITTSREALDEFVSELR
ncbi:D-alanyl-D-alanine carboxypeptidase/D-alanyl-D-alanine-endopeptidase [Corynebacterium sp. H128]|uniref:D-alanyl-D-alanine carboxypeptidase/D-alanyl-D-alanine endopeptidase n=1 Tax=unclassified Corynebacterium TaxID=2624378 RepID=UPI0030A760D3